LLPFWFNETKFIEPNYIYKLSKFPATFIAASQNGAHVVSVSWYQTCSFVQAHQDIINMIVANGTTVVTSAGNGTADYPCNGTDPDALIYPGAYDNVICVSGTDFDSYIEQAPAHRRFTFNSKVDITAPGWGIRTAAIAMNGTVVLPYTDRYATVDGTSYSTPMVAGTVGLMKTAKFCLTPSEIEYILKKTADPIVFTKPENAPFISTSGAGRLDAQKALQVSQNWPASLANYASITGPNAVCTNSVFTLNNIPVGMTIAWSTTGPVSIASGQGSLSVTLNKTGNGAGTVKATVSSSCGNVVISKSFNAGGPTFANPTVDGSTYYIGSSHGVCPGFHNAKLQIVNGSSPQQMSWTLSPGGAVSWAWDATNSQITFQTMPYNQTYPFSFTGTATNACATSSPFTFSFIKGPCANMIYTVWPNPASDELILEADTSSSTSEALSSGITIAIYNQQGTLQYSTKSTKQRTDIPLKGIPNGDYVLHLISKEGTTKQHFVISH
ncbi:S8 family serine peptidase, partial [Chryseolinea sp. T2]|uniref:S8 family serine peptidase n=1 Tax=Chryseolinea sp. T2 TaxID=3129255 RepID=UPI00307726F4